MSVKYYLPFQECWSFKGVVTPKMVEAREPDARIHRVIDVLWFSLMLDSDNTHSAPRANQ